jgi:hypothetical protein
VSCESARICRSCAAQQRCIHRCSPARNWPGARRPTVPTTLGRVWPVRQCAARFSCDVLIDAFARASSLRASDLAQLDLEGSAQSDARVGDFQSASRKRIFSRIWNVSPPLCWLWGQTQICLCGPAQWLSAARTGDGGRTRGAHRRPKPVAPAFNASREQRPHQGSTPSLIENSWRSN